MGTQTKDIYIYTKIYLQQKFQYQSKHALISEVFYKVSKNIESLCCVCETNIIVYAYG